MTKYTTLFLLLVLQPLTASDYQTFTSVDGLRIEAKVISLEGDMITIERKDKKRFTFPISRLSEADQASLDASESEEAVASVDARESDDALDVEALRKQLAVKYPQDEGMLDSEQKEVLSRAYKYLDKNDFEKSIESYASIPADSRRFADARRRAGFNVLGREMGRWEEALVFLLDAYEVAPKDPKVLEDLGRAYVRLDMYADARIILKKAGTRNAREALDEISGL